MATKHYVLWLLLPQAVRDRFAELIKGLAERYGTPFFEPHITLLGGLDGEEQDISTKAASLTRTLTPFIVRLTTADYLDEYFRCLFVRAESNTELVNAYRLAKKEFNQTGTDSYMPHVSLMYGNCPVVQKEAILQDIGRKFEIKFPINRVALYRIDSNHPRDWHCVQVSTLG